MVEWATEHAGGDKLEVIARLMRMFLGGVESRRDDPALAHVEVAGALTRMRVMVQRQSDGGQDKVEAIALVKNLENYWKFVSDTGMTGNKIVAKSWSIHGDRVLQ